MKLFLQEKEVQHSVSSCESSAFDTLKPGFELFESPLIENQMTCFVLAVKVTLHQ